MKHSRIKRRTSRRHLQTEEDFTIEGDGGISKADLKKGSRRKRYGRPISREMEQYIAEYVNYVKAAGVEGLRREFAELKTFVPQENSHRFFDANPTRNRYRDVICLDLTRVILTLNAPPETNYIHANWMRMPGCNHQYIATQGPLESTISDFWRMVYQEQITTIIMLCNIIENGKQKCSQYWPVNSGEHKTYGCMFVINKRTEHEDKFYIYILEVLPEGCSNSAVVKLIHMPDWPDRGVPPSGMAILRLVRRMPQNLPSIIHCSAGIGRTGTVVAIDTLLSHLWKCQPLKVPEVVRTMRCQRAQSVQNEAQYVFIYTTVLDYIKAKLPAKYREFVNAFHAEVRKAKLL